MPKSLKTIQDHVDHIVQARRATSKFVKAAPDAEKPSEIFAEITPKIATPLKQIGFSFNKSKRTFRRKINEFEHFIVVRADSENYPGVRAAYDILLGVTSSSLKAWRISHGLYPSEHVFVVALESADGGLLTWDFLDRTTREAETTDMLDKILESVTSIFAPWTSMPEASKSIAEASIIQRLDTRAEVALWLGNTEAAAKIIRTETDWQSVKEGLNDLTTKFSLPVV